MKFISYYFLLFIIYSILGWIAESIFVSFRQKKIVNRGFLIGPYCPIYGVGSLINIIYIDQYKSNIITVFILGLLICSVVEYITSYLMEKLFKARWWDYSDRSFNLNGRVCGMNALLFGIGSVVIIYITQPIISRIIDKIPDIGVLITSIIFFIIFIADTIISCNIVNKLEKSLSNLELKKDSTKEIKNLILDALTTNINGKLKKNTLQKRIIQAFPNFDFKKFIRFKNPKFPKLKGLFKK